MERRERAERQDRYDGPGWAPRIDPRDRYNDRAAWDDRERALRERDWREREDAPAERRPTPYYSAQDDGWSE